MDKNGSSDQAQHLEEVCVNSAGDSDEFTKLSGADLIAGCKLMNEGTNSDPLQADRVGCDETIDSSEVATKPNQEQIDEHGGVLFFLEDRPSGRYLAECSNAEVDPLRRDPLLHPSVSETSQSKVPDVSYPVNSKGFIYKTRMPPLSSSLTQTI